jgi:quinol monooxygenase YgiN
MVRVCLTIVSRGSGASSAVLSLRHSMVQAQKTRGCVRCQLSADLTDPDVLHYVEEWASESDLRAGIRAERLLRLIAIIESATEQPQFTIEFVSPSSGLDYIEDVLRSAEV